MVGVVTEIESLEMLEAAHEKAGTGEHDHRERHLRRDQRLPKASPPSRLGSRARVDPEEKGKIPSRGEERREDAEEQHRQHRHASCQGDRRTREADHVRAGDLRRRERQKDVQQPSCADEAERAAGRGEQCALRHE